MFEMPPSSVTPSLHWMAKFLHFNEQGGRKVWKRMITQQNIVFWESPRATPLYREEEEREEGLAAGSGKARFRRTEKSPRKFFKKEKKKNQFLSI